MTNKHDIHSTTNRDRLLAIFTILVLAFLYLYPDFLEPLVLAALAVYCLFLGSLSQWSDRYLYALTAMTITAALFMGYIPTPYVWLNAHHLSFGIAVVLTILMGAGVISAAVYALSIFLNICRRTMSD